MATLIEKGNPGYSKQQKQIRNSNTLTTTAPLNETVTQQPVKQSSFTQARDTSKSNPGTVVDTGRGQFVNGSYQLKPVTSDSMKPGKPLNITNPVTPTESTGLSENILAQTAAQKAISERDAETQRLQAESTKGREEITNLINQIGNSGNIQDEIYQQQGVDTARQQADDYTNQIEAEALSARRRIEKLQKENPQGLFGGALQDEVSRIDRESTSKQADLAILQNAALRRYDTAAAIADRQVQAKLEPMKANLEALKFFYTENKEALTKDQDRRYNETIKAEERAYNATQRKEEELNTIRKDLLKNGAPVGLIQAANNATELNELLVTPGISKYMQSPLERLQMQKYSQDIQKGTIDIAKAKKELAIIMNETAAPGLTADQRTDIVKNPIAQKAQARIGVIQAVQDYGRKVALYKEGRLTGPELRELDTALKTTVGSAINVAQGQGAMGDEEAKRILDNLEAGRLIREKKTQAAINGVIGAQDSLLQSEFGFIDSAIPGASDSFQLFSDYKRSKVDPLLVNETAGKDSLDLGL